MKKTIYENTNVEIIKLSEDDILRTSNDLPFFGEDDDLKQTGN